MKRPAHPLYFLGREKAMQRRLAERFGRPAPKSPRPAKPRSLDLPKPEKQR